MAKPVKATANLLNPGDCREMLRIMTAMAEQNHRTLGGYTSLFHFTHKNGRAMNRVMNPTREMAMWRTPKECYRNAAMIALKRGGRFIYCEGWAAGIVPVPHAWLVDCNGLTYDPTWGMEGVEYFGVAINQSFLRKVLKASSHYGIIDQPELGFPILTAHIREWRNPVMDRMEVE